MRASKRTPPIMAPAMAPAIEELPFLKDKKFGMHGKIIMIILVAIFSVFIFFIVLFPCLKRAATTTTNTKSFSEWRKQRRKRRTTGEDGASLPPQVILVSTQEQHKVNHEDELTKKFPS